MTKAAAARRPRVLYLGDLAGTSARYLVGALQWLGWPHVHHDATQPPPPALLEGRSDWDVIVLSDYSLSRLGTRGDEQVAALVREAGTGLVMLGGWSSFTGLNGGYRGSAVASALPVRMAESDDRRNLPNGLVLWPACSHPIVDGLSFRRPPVVVGCNSVVPRSTATVIMSGWELRFRGRGRVPAVDLGTARPMLAVGQAGKGRTVAFMTDIAPHWCGGMVDWGRGRLQAGDAEVGDVYVEFIRRLLGWAAFGER